MAPAPSRQAFVPFVSVANMMRLVHRIGIEKFMTDLSKKLRPISAAGPCLTRRPASPAIPRSA